MPGRSGYSVEGGWATSGSGSSLPAALSIDSRSGNDPVEYKATNSIDFVGEFVSGTGDQFEAYITQDAGSGGTGQGTGYAGGGYRYGFNGKENDNEVKGEGNQQDYGMRIYDPRLGRFLSVDPLEEEYPELTPYQFGSDRPIDGIDLDGLEFTMGQLKQLKEQGEVFLKKLSANESIISSRGFLNAVANANSFGVTDNLPNWTGLNTDNLSDYDAPYDQQAYLTGRLLGDVAAMVQSASEVDGGLTTAVAGSETLIVGGAGLIVAGHGAGVGAAATYDLNWALDKLKTLGVNFSATADGSNSTTNQSTNDQAQSAHQKNPEATNSNTGNGNKNQKSSKYNIRTTKDGSKAITIERPSGRIKDISKKRVKEYIPNPRNPSGKPARVNFKKSGSPKGTHPLPTDPKKRTLNKSEQKFIDKVNKAV